MFLKSLGRHFYIVQESYLSKSFSPEVDFGVTIVFLVHFRAKGARCPSESVLLAFLLPLHLLRKIPHFSYGIDWFLFFFPHDVRRGDFCSGGILDVSLLFLGTNHRPVLVKVSGIAVFRVTAVLGGGSNTLLISWVGVSIAPVLLGAGRGPQCLTALECSCHPPMFHAGKPGKQQQYLRALHPHRTFWGDVPLGLCSLRDPLTGDASVRDVGACAGPPWIQRDPLWI